MSQSRRWSAVEAVTSVGVGYLLAIVVQAYLFPMFGFHATTGEHMAIAAVFTVVSLLRSYAVRRAFNWLGQKRYPGLLRQLTPSHRARAFSHNERVASGRRD